MTRRRDSSVSGVRPLSYHPTERARDNEEWEGMFRSIAKARPPTLDELERLAEKRIAHEFLELLGLVDNGKPKVREIGRLIGKDESEVRAWLSDRRLDREVPASFYSRIRRAVGSRAIVAWQMVHSGWIRGEEQTGT